MFDEPVRRIIRKSKLVTAPPGTRVIAAARRMAKRNVGAILVVENGRLAGIITERDIVFRVVAQGLDPRTAAISEVMTPDPVTIEPSRPLGYALVIMHRGGFRHLPVVENGTPVGIVSARSALDPDLEEFASEKRRREHFAGMSAKPAGRTHR